VKKRKVDEASNAETWTLSKKLHEMNARREYTSHMIVISKELDADFNTPKIHLMSHWAKQVRPCGAFEEYSAGRHEQVHKTNLKDGWNASNHNLNNLPQVITFQRHILISNNRSFCVKHLGVLDGSDGSDGTSYPLTENYMLPLAQATGRVAYSPLLVCRWYTHHQNDSCVTLFAGATVML